MNNRSVTWIIVIVAGLLAVVALGLIIRGETPPPDAAGMVKQIPTAAQTPSIPPPAQPAPAPAPAAPAPAPVTPTAAPAPDRHSPKDPVHVPMGGYVKTKSGLQYYDITVGKGTAPSPGQTVKIEFTEWVQGGQKVASTLDGHGPVDFEIGTGEMMKGWDEAVRGMKVGGQRQVIIPPDLAYGHEGRPPKIPPDATLICDLELVSVE